MALHVIFEWIPGICVQLLLVKKLFPRITPPGQENKWYTGKQWRAQAPTFIWSRTEHFISSGPCEARLAHLRTVGRRTLRAEVWTSVVKPWGPPFSITVLTGIKASHRCSTEPTNSPLWEYMGFSNSQDTSQVKLPISFDVASLCSLDAWSKWPQEERVSWISG